jgi:hypothetical protein
MPLAAFEVYTRRIVTLLHGQVRLTAAPVDNPLAAR